MATGAELTSVRLGCGVAKSHRESHVGLMGAWKGKLHDLFEANLVAFHGALARIHDDLGLARMERFLELMFRFFKLALGAGLLLVDFFQIVFGVMDVLQGTFDRVTVVRRRGGVVWPLRSSQGSAFSVPEPFWREAKSFAV